MCLNLQCPPGGGLSKALKNRVATLTQEAKPCALAKREESTGYQTEEYHIIVCVQTINHGATDEFVASERDKKED